MESVSIVILQFGQYSVAFEMVDTWVGLNFFAKQARSTVFLSIEVAV